MTTTLQEAIYSAAWKHGRGGISWNEAGRIADGLSADGWLLILETGERASVSESEPRP